MKKTAAVLTASGVLFLGFFAIAAAASANPTSLCGRFPSLAEKFPSCRDEYPLPPADRCPNVPGDQSSRPCADDQCANQGGMWTGETCELPPLPPPPSDGGYRGNRCDRYVLTSRDTPPQSCDICPNVAGVQLAGRCADKLCVDEGGFWDGTSCIDFCPDVSGYQSQGPCTDRICVDDGGTWNGALCDFPPFVRITYPNGGETYNEGDIIEIAWESHKADSCRLGHSTSPSNLGWILGADLPGTQRAASWAITIAGDTDSPQPQKIYIICWVGAFSDYSDDYFTVIPRDVCPNVPLAQRSGPCANVQCVDNGGTWNGSSCIMPPPPTHACTDGIDNDGDGAIDFPADDGCSSASDDSEGFSGGAGGGGGASSGSGSRPNGGAGAGGGGGGGSN